MEKKYTTCSIEDADVFALPGAFEQMDYTPVDRETFFRATERNDFHICEQTVGSLLWESGGSEDGRPLLLLTSERTSQEYLDYLQESCISYVATGKELIDLNRCAEILRDRFDVELKTND